MTRADRDLLGGRRMSDLEALLWNVDKDPYLSSNFGSVTLLASSPDLGKFRRRMIQAVSRIPRLHQRVVPALGRMAPPEWQDDLMGPGWVRRMWGTRGGRIGLALLFLGGCAWILASGISDPDDFFDRPRAMLAFVCVPFLNALFGYMRGEAVRDVARGENRRPLLTERRMQRPMAIILAIYVPVAVVAVVLWH